MNKILKINNITKKYNTINGEIDAIENINFEVNKGEFIAIIGTSGCGKSTLLSIISGLTKPSKGTIKFYSPCKIGYMLQQDALFNHLNINDNILLGLKIKKDLTKENISNVNKMIKKYNLDKFKYKKPSELSGGMKQRVALIRTLAINPDILLLDEPFCSLDFSTKYKVCDDIYKIIKENKKTTIMVTHDITEAISMADKIIILNNTPSTIQEIIKIELNNKSTPLENLKDKKFNIYYNYILERLNNNV